MQISLETNMTEGKPLNGKQKEYIKMIRKSFKNYKLEIQELQFFRYEHDNFREQYLLEEEEEELKEKKQKEAAGKKKRKVKFHMENQIKAIITTNYEKINQFVFTSHVLPATVDVIENVYTFYYPKHLESGILWGRYSKEAKHGGGEFYFAPTSLNLTDLLKERGKDIISDDVINDIQNLNGDELLATNKYSICDFITRIRHSNRLKNEFSSFKRKLEEEFFDSFLIEKLNAEKDLAKVLSQEVITFGEHSIFNVADFKSDLDIAIMAFNFKSGCIIQLANFTKRITRTMIVIKKLVEVLNSLTGKG